MSIPLKLMSAPLGALVFASMIAMAPAAETRGGAAPASDRTTILGPAMLRPGTADLSCGVGPAGLGPWGADRIEQALSFTPDQSAKFSDLKDASQKARQYLHESCPTDDPVTPAARLDTMERRLEAMLEAVRTVKPALEGFYSSLTDEQKARLNALDPVVVTTDRGADRTVDRTAAPAAAPAAAPTEHPEAVEHAAPARHASYRGRRHWSFRLPFLRLRF